MIGVNLSGLQSLDIPPSLFDEFFEKSSHYGGAMFPEGRGVEVDVLHEKENKYQTKEEPALVVKLDNCTIGYIPVLSTIERYISDLAREMAVAMEMMNAGLHNKLRKDWERQNDRYSYASSVRDQVELDLFRNHLPVKGELTRVQVADDTGRVLSVSVGFKDIM